MYSPHRPHRCVFRELGAVSFGVLLFHACGGSPVPPTPVPGAPTIECPAPVSMQSPTGQPMTVSYGAPTVTGGAPPTSVSCSPATGATFPLGSTQVACTATDQLGRMSSCMFAVAILAPPRLSVTRFLAFGDSITWGEDGKNPPPGLNAATLVRPMVQLPAPDTYPGALMERLTARYTAQSPQVANGGRPGETVTDPMTLSRFVGFTSSGSYDVVLLMEGANDLVNDNVSEVMAGLGRMIDDAKSRQIPVLLATIPPENPDGYDPKNRGTHAAQVAPFNDHVRELAASKGVPLVDVYQAFGGDLTLIGTDGLHPTASGYHLIADTFFASIKQLFELPAVPTSSRLPVQSRSVRRHVG